MRVWGRMRREWRYWRRLIRDPRTPRWSRWLLVLACAYLVTPLDLIPDWIPLLGWGDDLVVVPLLVFAALRGIPRGVRRELRE